MFVNMVGALTEVREMSTERIVEAVSHLPVGEQPRVFVNVLPAAEVVKQPSGRVRLDKSEELCRRLLPTVSVVNVRVGRVIGLDTV